MRVWVNGTQEHVRATNQRLNEELTRLKILFDSGHSLRVRWVPTRDSNLEGEVRDDIISIYVEDVERASRILRHEFLDWMVSQAVRPYKEIADIQRTVINLFLKGLEGKAYSTKEGVVEKLRFVFWNNREDF